MIEALATAANGPRILTPTNSSNFCTLLLFLAVAKKLSLANISAFKERTDPIYATTSTNIIPRSVSEKF